MSTLIFTPCSAYPSARGLRIASGFGDRRARAGAVELDMAGGCARKRAQKIVI